MFKKKVISHFHGSNKSFKKKTGYTHNTETYIDSTIEIVDKILKSGLNVMVLQEKDANIIYMDDGRFCQR